MANKLAKIIIAGPLPLQAWNLLWWAPALETQNYTLAPFLCRPEIYYGGSQHRRPNLHTGPLPLQAENNHGGPQHWKPTSTHWPPSSAGRKQLWWAPALETHINTLAPFLCRPEIHYGGPHRWRPPKINTLAPFLCRPEIILLAPLLCRPKSTWAGPTLQAKIKYHWPHSAGRNSLLLAPLCRPKSTTGGPTLQAENNLLLSQQGHGNTTIYPNRTSMPAILPPAPLQWWPPQ